MDKFEKWKLIEVELRNAYSLLPNDVVESDNGYCEEDFLTYLNHNELLLAMEELEGVDVDNQPPNKQFWKHLIKAASLMNRKHVARYQSIQNSVAS